MNETWNREELKASVDAYLEMHRLARKGESFTKRRYYEALARRFARTEKAFEYRMQNISYVLTLMGREWLSGLRPAKNVGTNMAAEIEKLINDAEGHKTLPVAAFETEVRKEFDESPMMPPSGNSQPDSTAATVSNRH